MMQRMRTNEEISATISERCLKMRRAKKLSRAVVERKTGVSYATIWNIENGIWSTSAVNIAKLAAAYGCSTDYLLGLTNRPGGQIEYR